MDSLIALPLCAKRVCVALGLVIFALHSTATAQLNPVIPPVKDCHCHWRPCPDCEVSCYGPPAYAVSHDELSQDPRAANAWPLTVQDAIFVALENSQVVRNLGLVDAGSDVDIVQGNITMFDPLEARSRADSEWGIFDPLWTTRIQWDKSDIPPGTSFSGIGDRPDQLDTADFVSSVNQLLPVGSRFQADFVVDYLFNPERPLGLDPNPQHFTYTQFGYVQPLLRGLGQDITLAPIRIASAQAQQTDWELKLQILALLRSIETTYWNAYAEQKKLETIEEMIPLFREVVRVRQQQASNQLGAASAVSRAEADLFRYEQQRLRQLSKIAEHQLVLRNLMGLPPGDGRHIKLIASPRIELPVETVDVAIATSAQRRPDVLRQRLAVYVAQQECLLARDALSPVLDFNAFWRINGLDNDLIGSIDVQQDNQFHDWQLGVTFEIPLGRRQGRANVRAAQFAIQKQRALLDQVAHQASFEVADAFRRITWLHKQHAIATDRLRSIAEWRDATKAQLENPAPGVGAELALEQYVQTLRDFEDASAAVYAVLADYNGALARLEETKGTLLDTRLVSIDGDTTGDLPDDLPMPTLAR